MNDYFKKEKLQELEYSFPYHYISSFTGDKFTQSREWTWGYQYLATCEFIEELIRDIVFDNLLDVGCGDGYLLQHLASRRNKKFLGIDYSSKCIGMAKSLNKYFNVEYEVIDIISEQLDDRFDVVTLIETLEHIKPEKVNIFLQSIYKALSVNGSFILTVPSKNKKLSPKHYQHFTFDDLSELLTRVGFKIRQKIYIARIGKYENRFVKTLVFVARHLPNSKLAGKLYKIYKQKLFVGDENNAGRILVISEK